MSKDKKQELKYNEPWIMQRADPYVIKAQDGFYYFTASIPTYDRIALRRAHTLAELPQAEEVTIWKKHEKGPMGDHIWAPEQHFVMGKWYIYFGAGDAENKWNLRPYVLECQGSDLLHDPWVERGIPARAQGDEFSFTSFSLDGTVFENHGKWFYIWAEKTGTGKMISNLYIAEMVSPYALGTAQVLLTTPDYDWERVGYWVDEGPAVIKRNGRVFVTFSSSETGISYCIGMMTADENADLLDPRSWEKSRYPVLQSDPEKGIYGPGHNSFTTDENGNDIMVYHARIETEIIGDPLYNPNRHAMLMPVRWGKDGAPVFEFS